MKLVSDGNAPKVTQPTEGATYDPMLNKKELCKINWDQSAENIHNFIRGLDSSPGAWTIMDGKEVSIYWLYLPSCIYVVVVYRARARLMWSYLYIYVYQVFHIIDAHSVFITSFFNPFQVHI